MSIVINQKYIWLACGLLSLVVSIFAFRSAALPDPPKVKTIQTITDSFFSLVMQDQLEGAFDHLSDTFQASIQNDPQRLRQPLESLGLYKQGESVSIDWYPSYPFLRDTTRQFLTGRFYADGQPKAVVITHAQDANQAWKIHAITVANLTDDTHFDLLDIDTRLKKELKKSAILFFSSVKNNEINRFYEYLSQSWKDKIRADDLQSKFSIILNSSRLFEKLAIDNQNFHINKIDKTNDIWSIDAYIDSLPSTVNINADYINEGFEFRLNKFEIRVQCYLGPFCSSKPSPKNILLLIDNSNSVSSTEKESFKSAIKQFISQIRGDVRMRIRLYGQESADNIPVSSPLVTLPQDGTETLNQFIDQNLNFQETETHTADAVQAAIGQLEADASPKSEKMIILINDGRLFQTDARMSAKRLELTGPIAIKASILHIPIHTVAIRLDKHQAMLKDLSEKTQGYHLQTLFIQESDHSNNLQTMLGILAELISGAETPDRVLETWLQERSRQRFYLEGGFASPAPPLTLKNTIAPKPPESPTNSPIGGPSPRAFSPMRMALFALAACGLLGFAFLWYRESAAKNLSPVIIEDNVDMCLRGIGGEALGMYHPMNAADIIRIGKAEPNHLILGKLLCMNQAIIQYRDSSYWLDDAGSLGGTYLNGERVLTAQPLRTQSEIRFNIHDARGSVAYIFQFCKNDSRTASS